MPKYSKIARFDGLLGKYPDPFIARLAGVTTEAVRQRRLVLGIKAFERPLNADVDMAKRLIGTMFDTDVSKLTGVSVAWVRKLRIAEGLGPYVAEDPIAPYEPLMGTMTDEDLGKIAGVSKQAITARRKARGQASYRDLLRDAHSGDG
ncbi:hypothetical protein [Pseudomonas syringae]|uniref:hypothetical protein n=1 Tax=Pseudomonas syringae TaxID=317 RepID=UPI00128F342D|nr:hypothetical protein [Pseudomonas syringae]QGG78933.1 hypothetical protein N028_26780 [Pseudomonas syringae USA011]